MLPRRSIALLIAAGLAGCAGADRRIVLPARELSPTPEAYLRLAGEVEANLQRHVLAMWFPRAVDRERGGFYQSFKEDWTGGASSDKTIVYQSRLTWVASQAAMRYPAQADFYLPFARHGLECLAEKLWDREHGGFFWAVDANGRLTSDRGRKHVYGIAFGIYAAVAEHAAARDVLALDLAKRAFAWLEEHAHDPRNGGYYEALTRQGRPILTAPADPNDPVSDAIGTRYGYKSMNSHIHLLEAFTALYEVWPDPLVAARLEEVFRLVRDRIAVEPGCLHLYFTPDWRPLPDHDSFGHDVETAYLLTEAAAALGQPDDARAWSVARQLVDHALDFGWDDKSGGFYDAGGAFRGPGPEETDKIWWVQAEGLNALLLMHDRFGRQSPRYWQAFVKQWEFIRTRQVDARHGGWFSRVRGDGTPIPGLDKSDPWTECYHQARALLNVGARLRRLAGEPTTRP